MHIKIIDKFQKPMEGRRKNDTTDNDTLINNQMQTKTVFGMCRKSLAKKENAEKNT